MVPLLQNQKISLMVKKSLRAQPLTEYYSINSVNGEKWFINTENDIENIKARKIFNFLKRISCNFNQKIMKFTVFS